MGSSVYRNDNMLVLKNINLFKPSSSFGVVTNFIIITVSFELSCELCVHYQYVRIVACFVFNSCNYDMHYFIIQSSSWNQCFQSSITKCLVNHVFHIWLFQSTLIRKFSPALAQLSSIVCVIISHSVSCSLY